MLPLTGTEAGAGSDSCQPDSEGGRAMSHGRRKKNSESTAVGSCLDFPGTSALHSMELRH